MAHYDGERMPLQALIAGKETWREKVNFLKVAISFCFVLK